MTVCVNTNSTEYTNAFFILEGCTRNYKTNTSQRGV